MSEEQTNAGEDTVGEEPKGSIDRRDLLKKGAIGAGAAGVVWAAPKIDGLSLRPDYASAGTSGPGNDSPGFLGDLVLVHDIRASGAGQSVTVGTETIVFNSDTTTGGVGDGNATITVVSSTNNSHAITSVNFVPTDDGGGSTNFTANTASLHYSGFDDGAQMFINILYT